MADSADSIGAPDAEEAPLLDWDEAHATFRSRRAFCDTLPSDHPKQDAAVDDYCTAMDHLILNVPSPNVEALRVKIELIRERYEHESLIEDLIVPLLEDACRLIESAAQ